MNIKVGDQFRLFRKGRVYQVTAITNSKIKFQGVGGIETTGSFPLDQAKDHFRSHKFSNGS